MQTKTIIVGSVLTLLGGSVALAQDDGDGTFSAETYNDCDITVAPGASTSKSGIIADYETATYNNNLALEIDIKSEDVLCVRQPALDPTPPLLHALAANKTYRLRLYGDAYTLSPANNTIQASLEAVDGTHQVFPDTNVGWSGYYVSENRPRITVDRESTHSALMHVEYYGKTVTFRFTGCGAPIDKLDFAVKSKTTTDPGVHFEYGFPAGTSDTLELEIYNPTVAWWLGHTKPLSGTDRKVEVLAGGGQLRLGFNQNHVRGRLTLNNTSQLFDLNLDALGVYDVNQNDLRIRVKPVRTKRTGDSLLTLNVTWRGLTVILELSEFH